MSKFSSWAAWWIPELPGEIPARRFLCRVFGHRIIRYELLTGPRKGAARLSCDRCFEDFGRDD